METLAWMNNTVHPTFTHIFMPQKFTDKAAVHDDLRAYNTQLYRGLLGELQALVQTATAAGQPWLGGANFGPLDAYSLTLTRWGSMAGIDPLDFPDLWAFVQAWPARARSPASSNASACSSTSSSRPELRLRQRCRRPRNAR